MKEKILTFLNKIENSLEKRRFFYEDEPRENIESFPDFISSVWFDSVLLFDQARNGLITEIDISDFSFRLQRIKEVVKVIDESDYKMIDSLNDESLLLVADKDVVYPEAFLLTIKRLLKHDASAKEQADAFTALLSFFKNGLVAVPTHIYALATLFFFKDKSSYTYELLRTVHLAID